MTVEEYENMMTEEEREAMTVQQYLHQLDMLRTINTFLLMGYEKDVKGIYEGMKRMLSEPETLAYYKEKAAERGNYFSKEKTVKAVEEMLDEL